jgi:hypothetical protein
MKRFLAHLAALALLLAAAAVPVRAQTQFQFPNAPWQAYAPARIQCGQLLGANFNTTSDNAIQISVPSATYVIDSIVVSNPSVSLTTAAGGVYSAASKGGVAIVANSQVFSALTTNAANTTGNALALTLSTAGNTTAFQGFGQASKISTLYLSLTTAQGAAASADVRVYCRPAY